MGHFCINRSGKNLTVTRVNNGGECVGTIAPNEVFVWTGAWSGNGVEGADSQAVFFKKNGIFFETGWINGATASGGLTPLVHCSLYDVDTGMGNGVESVFQTKYPVKRFDTKGNFVDTLPINTFVTTKEGACGASNRNLMYISSRGVDGGDPVPCESFIDVCEAGMIFKNTFSLLGTLR